VTLALADRLVCLADVRVSGEQALVGWFATHPDHRRKGHASACLQRALAHVRERGAAAIRTHGFTDSRNTAACAFLEHRGFTVRDPEHQNIVMQIDMDHYEPRPVELPEGYRVTSLRMDRLQDWVTVKDAVFESKTTPEWFMANFGSRPDFDPAGWHVLYCEDEPIGIAGADFHRDPAHPETISGCQIEWVGVLDTHRGKRLGESLMRTCLNYTKQHGVNPCQLITQIFRQAAVLLYEKLGFRHVREDRTYERPL